MTRQRDSILPTEVTHPVSRRALAATVIAVLASGLLFNFGIKLLLEARPALDNPTYAGFHVQWRRLTGLDAPVETLIIGDSSGRHGVDPAVLDEALGTTSVNLCTMGDAAITNPAWQLEEYIRRHGPPRRAILVAVHDVWKRRIKLPLIPRVPLRWGFWSRMRASLQLSRDEYREVFLSRFAPVYAQDQTVLDLLMQPWDAGKRQLWFGKNGFSPLPEPDPDLARREFQSHNRWIAPAGWSISPSSRRALDAMIAMAEEYGFELHVANSPLLVGMVEDEIFGPYLQECLDGLAGLVAGSPRAHLILAPPVEYPAEQMQSTDHIAAVAVPDFTRRLAAAVTAAER